MEDIRSLDLREMQQLAERMEEKPFRGKQLFQWVHGHQVSSWRSEERRGRERV